ncbi:MAG: phosphohistidine phosphatase SixA [Bryobacteraceae bacterium]
MELYLLRHGIAEPGKPGSPDSDRALTPEGIRKLRGVLRAAKAAELAPGLIVSSPYRRAIETAEIAARALGYQGEVAQSAALVPASRPSSVWDEVRTLAAFEQVLLVGHEPLFSQTCAYLLASPAMLVDFKKGAIARIDFDSLGQQPKGVLRWLLTPKLAGE